MTRIFGRHRAPELRALHLLDLENLVSGVVTPDSVRDVWARYERLVGVDRTDAVVVATSARNAAVAAFNLPRNIVRVIGEDCADGADIALLDSVDPAHAVRRYQRLCLASCDHFFVPVARAFVRAGLPVTQVIGSSLVSTRLYGVCTSHVYLSSTPRAVPSPAVLAAMADAPRRAS